MRVRRSVLVPLALVAACTSGHAAPRALPSVSPSASPRSSAAPPAGVVVAVQDGSAVRLYRVGLDRKAVPLVSFAPPPAMASAAAVTLSAGERPTTCIVWESASQSNGTPSASELRCYPYGDTSGSSVEVDGELDQGASLSSDGGALAWTESTASQDEEHLVTTSLRDGRATAVRRVPMAGHGADSFGCGNGVVGTAWSEERLVVDCGGTNDQPGPMVVYAVPIADDGQEVPEPSHQNAPDGAYSHFADVVGADARTALVVETGFCAFQCQVPLQPPRAVRIDLATGRVLEVIAVAAKNRDMESVSGGADGIVYVTSGKGGERAYVRFPDDSIGRPITGLPRGASVYVAQP